MTKRTIFSAFGTKQPQVSVSEFVCTACILLPLRLVSTPIRWKLTLSRVQLIYYLILFFSDSYAILDFKNIAMHRGLCSVIELF